jgi:hypothetical protein
MKTFVKENWYKLMIGSSMFIFSVSALIYSVSPARAENVFKAKSNSAGTPFYVVVNGVVYYTKGDAGAFAEFYQVFKQPEPGK